MDIPLSLPLDRQGFVRRECPNCEQQFKWHHGPANEEAEHEPTPSAYYCPLCGVPAGLDAWFTREQLDFAQAMVMPVALRHIQDELARAFRGNKHMKYKPGNRNDLPAAPPALTEPDDMQVVSSPCHAWEPVKVPEGLAGPLHCLICGERYAI